MASQDKPNQRSKPDFNTITNESFTKLVDSMNFMSDKFDDSGKQIKEVLSSIKETREENRFLKEQNIKLKNEIQSLENRVNTLEQKGYDLFIEISGVLETKDEVCVEMVEKVATKLGVKTLITKAFCVYSKIVNKPRKIVATMSDKQSKNSIISSARKMKPKGKMIQENWEDNAIYVNDYLTPFNRNLFFKTKSFAREAGFKYA